MAGSIHEELGHRGSGVVEYPRPEFLKALGGDAGVAELIGDLYRRIEADERLRQVFPHFQPRLATPFFVQWFGGGRGYSDGLDGGLLRRHRHRYISAKAAGAWLRCMREALESRGIDADVLRPLSRIANAMVHSDEIDLDELCRSCGAVQDAGQVRFERLLEHAVRGRDKVVKSAILKDPAGARCRGTQNRTLAWVATYHNRPKVLELVLEAGGDCISPGCDPMHTTMACDVVRMGTGVSVTPLAMARKWHPEFVEPLTGHGAIDDVFTAAWLGDVASLRDHLNGNPELVNAIDPADDFQEASVLCHAVCGGNIEAARLLLERGAEVARHSGKLLTLAVVMNRLDLVTLLVESGADVQRTEYLGRLDDAQRPIADLLIGRGKKVPEWMLPHACRSDVSSNEVHRVRALLDYGAGFEDRNRFGLTALHYAVRGGKLPLIKLLLDRGADPNVKDAEGLTPILHLAKTRSKADPMPILELLVGGGANVTARDEKGRTAMTLFTRQGKEPAARWLAAHGSRDAE